MVIHAYLQVSELKKQLFSFRIELNSFNSGTKIIISKHLILDEGYCSVWGVDGAYLCCFVT